MQEQHIVVTDKKGIAELYLVSEKTVNRWLSQGLPHLKLGWRSLRFSVPEVQEWVRTKYGEQRFHKLPTPLRRPTATVAVA